LHSPKPHTKLNTGAKTNPRTNPNQLSSCIYLQLITNNCQLLPERRC
jgi:hypothetical protein